MSQASTYYLWKWANNALPGQPNEVFSELLRGRIHPALQPFDARPILQQLQATAEKRRILEEEWEWQIMPAAIPGHAHSIFLKCPTVPKMGGYCRQFAHLCYKWNLSGYDEQYGTIISCLLPKKNCFVVGWNLDDAEEKYDVSEADLTELLRRLQPGDYAIFGNRVNHSVTCSACHNGFKVGWRAYLYDSITDSSNSDSWQAGYRLPVGERPQYRIVRKERVGRDWEWHTVRVKDFENEKLRFDDVVLIFQAFLRGESRPAQYQWRSMAEMS